MMPKAKDDKSKPRKKTAGTGQAARNRAAAVRAVYQEELRAKISGAVHISSIQKILAEMDKRWATMSSEQTSAQRLLLDTNFRMLAKVLPDLKSIEITDPKGDNPFVEAVKQWVAATKS